MKASSSKLFRLTWSQVREHFENEWVELVDYRWDWNTPHPRWAIIRNHARDRRDLMRKVSQAGSLPGAVILHVSPVESVVSFDSLSAAI